MAYLFYHIKQSETKKCLFVKTSFMIVITITVVIILGEANLALVLAPAQTHYYIMLDVFMSNSSSKRLFLFIDF